jgi:hypothetical protein
MKNSLKVFILIALVSVPATIHAQGEKHAINTKGAGSGDKVALAPCPEVERSVIIAAQERLKTRTKSNQTNERSGMPASVTPNGVQPQDVQKTKTKSNNANDRTAAPAVRVLQLGCSETAAVDMGQAITFEWSRTLVRWTGNGWAKQSNAQYIIKVWQLRDGQTAADGIAPENLVLEKIVQAGVDFLDLDAVPRRPRDVSTSFVWEVQPLDAAGKASGAALRATYDLATLKK